MAHDSSGKAATGRNAGKDDREARLAEALRANLRRRKVQSAARKDLPESEQRPDDDASPVKDETSRNDKP